MQSSKGFTNKIEDNYVCLLKKSLYDLKQSLRQLYKKFDTHMTRNNFKISCYSSCVYYKEEKEIIVYLLMYIDDMLIAYKDTGLIERVKCMLKSEFEMKELDPTKKILGMEIKRIEMLQFYICPRKITFSQEIWYGTLETCSYTFRLTF